MDLPGNRASSYMSPGLMSSHGKTVPVPRENTYYLLRKRLLLLDWERNKAYVPNSDTIECVEKSVVLKRMLSARSVSIKSSLFQKALTANT